MYLLQIDTKKSFLIFKTQGLYYHKLVFCKLVNLQNRRYWDESLGEKYLIVKGTQPSVFWGRTGFLE